MQEAIFAAGCFWGVQYYLDQIPGVVSTLSGYSGGDIENPIWEDVHTQTTGHAEVVLVKFEVSKVSFETLTRHFFRMHNPTLLNTDGINIGNQYRSVIFYVTNEQKEIAEKVMAEEQSKYDKPIVTQIEQAGPFYEAEGYHQKFAERTGRGICHVPYAPLA